MNYLINRFKEPSSWAALAALLAGLGINLDGEMIKYVTQIGLGVAGLLGFFLAEKAKK